MTTNKRMIGAVWIAMAFLLFAMGCSSTHHYPVTKAGAKAERNNQRDLKGQFP